MSDSPTLENINPKSASAVPTASQVSGGIPIPAVRLLQVMSSDEWEGFTEEWLSFHKTHGTYQSIKRFSGSGDLGLDVVAFTAKEGFAKPWDSYQCKHYNHALTPGDVYGEIGKIIYHSFLRTPPFNQSCRVPLTPPMTRSPSTRPRRRGVRPSSSHRPGRRTSLATARGRPRGIGRSRG